MTSNKVKELWEEYLAHNPTKQDLRGIFFGCSTEGVTKEMAWGELKKHEDLKNEDLVHVIFLSRNAKNVREKAWEILSKRNPSKDDLESIINCLGISHPIAKKAQKILGRGKSEILCEIHELVTK